MKKFVLAFALLAMAGLAWAGEGPGPTIRIIVPYTAGGNSDNIARLFARGLAERLSQNVIIDNRPGASGQLGANLAVRSPNDGSVLFLAPTAVFVVDPHIRKLPYNPLADLTPVAKLTTWVPVLAVTNGLPVNSFGEFVSYTRAHPGKVTFASTGVGSMTDLIVTIFARKLGLDVQHVPYKGSSEFVPDLLSGRVDAAFDSVVLPQILAGQIKVFASLADARHPALPNVPTLKELGADIDAPNWYGLFAPKNTPPATIDRITRAAQQVMADIARPENAAILTSVSMYPSYEDPKAFAQELAREDAFLADMIKRENITAE